MIKNSEKKNKKTVITFGTGDIGMNCGFNNKDTKCLVFYQAEPGEIGRTFDTKFEKTEEFYKEPLVFEFLKDESIDAVIRQLEELKEMRINKSLKRETRF